MHDGRASGPIDDPRDAAPGLLAQTDIPCKERIQMPARNGIDQADESSKAPATMNNNTEQPHSEDRIKMSEKPEQTATPRPQPQSGRPGSTSPTGSRTATGGMTPPGKVLTGKLQQFIIAARRLGGMMMAPLG